MFEQVFPFSNFIYSVTQEELIAILPPYYSQEIEGELFIGVENAIEALSEKLKYERAI